MGLTPIVAYIKTAVGDLAPVLDPQDQVGPYPLIVVYPYPGDSTPMQHSGRGGRPVHTNRDVVVVEWHTQIPDLGRFFEAATPFLDAMRLALWTKFANDRYGGLVHQLHAVQTDHLGKLAWNSDDTLGIRLFVDLSHAVEV